jgi:hypothetical protein
MIGQHVLLPEHEKGAKGVGLVSTPALIHSEQVRLPSVSGSEEDDPLLQSDVSHLGMHGSEQRIEGEPCHGFSGCARGQARRFLFQAQFQLPADFQEPRETGQ